jgi:hypothetical protein
MPGTLEIKDEKRGENTAEEELHEQVRRLPGQTRDVPTQIGSRHGRLLAPRSAPGQPQREHRRAQEKPAQTPEIQRGDALAERQRVGDETAEKSGQRVKTAEKSHLNPRKSSADEY